MASDGSVTTTTGTAAVFRPEAFDQGLEVRQRAGVEIGLQWRAASSASQARSCASARRPTMVRQACFSPAPASKRVEGQGIGAPGKELIAIDEIEQRHRLAAQGMDHMAIVDDMAMFAVRPAAARAAR